METVPETDERTQAVRVLRFRYQHNGLHAAAAELRARADDLDRMAEQQHQLGDRMADDDAFAREVLDAYDITWQSTDKGSDDWRAQQVVRYLTAARLANPRYVNPSTQLPERQCAHWHASWAIGAGRWNQCDCATCAAERGAR